MATQLEDEIEDMPAVEEAKPEPQEEATEPDAPDADEEVDVVEWGGGAVSAEPEPEGMRNLRNRLREVERENRTLKGQPKVDDIGEEPDPEDYWDKPEQFKVDLRAYDERKRKAEEATRQQEDAQRRQQERWERQRSDYDRGFEDLRASGKDTARGVVEDAFPGEQLAYLIKAAGSNAAAFVYALGNNPDKRGELQELAKDGSWAEFIAAAAVMSKEVTLQRRKPSTQPEKQHRGGGAPPSSDTKLERLEREARQSGDRTELIAYRRKLREMGGG